MEDILSISADWVWTSLKEMAPPLRTLFFIWALILSILTLAGLLFRLAPWPVKCGAQTTALQSGALLLCVLVSFSVPLGGVAVNQGNFVNLLLLLALAGWICFPYFLPRVFLRRWGFQNILIPILYGAEIILFGLQLFFL